MTETPRKKPPSVLLITADGGARAGLTSVLQLTNWKVQDASAGRLGFQMLRSSRYDAVVIDQTLPDVSGLALVLDARRVLDPQLVIVLLVDRIDRSEAITYLKAGIDLFLAKPLRLADACARISGLVPGAEALSELPEHSDPLARPVVVVASPSLNVRDTAIKSLGDEFEVVHYDGTGGIPDERRRAGVILVDDGVLGGFDLISSLHAIFGEAPAVALAVRGVQPPAGYCPEPLIKPLRGSALVRAVRLLTDRVLVGVNPFENGVFIKLRDGWNEADEPTFNGLLARVTELADHVPRSGRKWVALVGPYLGAPRDQAKTKELVKACSLPKVTAGLVTAQPNAVRVAHALNLHPSLVQTSTTEFIKMAQETV